ncbi:MAG: M91 family zinc metallopeptidase [Thermoanaerobaculia bacterium]
MHDPVSAATETTVQAPAQATEAGAAGATYQDGGAPAATPTALIDSAARTEVAAAAARQLGSDSAPLADIHPAAVSFNFATASPRLSAEATETRLPDGRIALDAGAGDDRIRISQDQSTGEVAVDINGEVHTYTQQEASRLVVRAGAGDDFIDTNDDVTANLTLEGNDGEDFVVGGAGDDRIEGGTGKDTLFAGAGRDYVYGGAGEDFIRGEEGDDILYGGNDRDSIFAGAGDDHVDAGKGNDEAWGGTGNDILSGGLGDDALEGGDGGTVGSQSGSDIFYAGRGSDRVSGGTGDVAYVEEGDDVVRGYREGSDLERKEIEIDPDLGADSIQLGPGLSTDERERILSDIETLRSSPTGQQGLAAADEAFRDTGHTVTIHTYSQENGAARSANWNDAMLDPATGRRGPGTDADIDYNPQLSSLNFTNGRSNPANNSGDFHDLPPVAVLYHELAHAYDIQTGNIDFRSYTGAESWDNGSRTGRATANAERVAVGLPYDHDGDPRTPEQTDANHPAELTENALRGEFGLPDRPNYSQ